MELIAGRFRTRGEGIALLLSRNVTGTPHDEVVSSPQMPGPFVVVSCWLRQQQPGAHSAELLVAGVGPVGVLGFGEGRSLGGYRLMEAGSRQVRDGATTLVDPSGEAVISGRRVGETWYPFYVYEGGSGAIVLVVRRHDLAGVVCRWNAGVTVWLLEAVQSGNPNGGNPNGRHRSSRAAWRGSHRPERRVRAPVAFAAGRPVQGDAVGRVPGEPR